MEEYWRRNIQYGYMFQNQDGTKMKTKVIESKIHGRLETVRVLKLNLIAQETEIQEKYGVFCSYRRGGMVVATNHGAPPLVIELNRCWKKSHQSWVSCPNIMIWEHYTDVHLVLDQLLEFS